MTWAPHGRTARRRTGLAIVMLAGGVGVMGFATVATASAAEKGAVADAAETVAADARTERVRALIAEGADVNEAQADGMTGLHWAVYYDDTATAQLLIGAGADVNATNRYGVPPLSLAATNANGALVSALLEAGADANVALEGGETVLMTAARTGSIGAVRALLVAGADPNATERRGQTALMWAAAEGHNDIVHALIEAGAGIGTTLPSGFDALFFAVREGRIDVVSTLLAAGMDVNAVLERVVDGPDEEVNNASFRPVDDGMSPLLLAVRNGHFELAIALVQSGADPNDTRTGFAPLHTMSWVRKPDASDRGDPSPIGSGNLTSLDFVRELVALGADVNLQLADNAPQVPNTASTFGTGGATPFVLAADRADIPLMRLLLELGADPLIPNAEASTALMAAAGLGTGAPEEEAGTEEEAYQAVELLLELGADINAIDDKGDTAMHGAAYGSFPSIVQLLSDRGADIEIWSHPNNMGRTPLFIAEGHRGGLPRPSRETIAVITALMDGAGISTEGPRPELIDMYAPKPKEETPPQ